MALTDHFVENAGPVSDGGNGFDRISIHAFVSSLAAAKKGGTGWDGTLASRRTKIISLFNLQAADLPQLDLILTPLSALTVDGDIALFLFYLTQALMGIEGGVLTIAEAASLAGLV